MTITTEAVVIGGGVMGASILYNLVSRGVRSPLLLERSTLGAGSTGRSSGAITMHYSTEVNARLAWESLHVFRNWRDVVGGDGDPAFVRTGCMVFAPAHEADGFRDNIAMQQRIGIDTRIVGWVEARELAPAFHLGEDEQFAWEEQSGHGDSSGTALAYATRARELGASVILESPATGVVVSGGRVVSVTTASETYETNTAVIATGPWSSRFLRKLDIDLPLTPTRHEVILIRRSETGIEHHPGGGDMTNLILLQAGGGQSHSGRQRQPRGGSGPGHVQSEGQHGLRPRHLGATLEASPRDRRGPTGARVRRTLHDHSGPAPRDRPR